MIYTIKSLLTHIFCIPGDIGTIQIQDMRFTVSDILPGAIIVQFNAAGSSPGQVALWNSLVTVGGTRGASSLTDACTDPSNECQAAFTGIHFAPTSSAYLENVWNWVADHITEGFSGGSNIAGKGGVLVQATKGTWIHGLGSEHWWLYQLNLFQVFFITIEYYNIKINVLFDSGIKCDDFTITIRDQLRSRRQHPTNCPSPMDSKHQHMGRP